MRLYNIYFICKESVEYLENIDLKQGRDNHGNIYYDFLNWRIVEESLNILYSVPSLKKNVSDVYNSIPALLRDYTTPRLSEQICNTYKAKNKELVIRLQSIIELYESMTDSDAEIGIDVKIPKCENLKEYMGYLKDIDFIFTQCPYLISKEEKIEFNTVDVGSMWLNFIVVSGASFYILNNIAKLIEKAIQIKSNWLAYKQQEEMLEIFKQQNKAGEEVLDVFKTMKDMVVKDAVSELESEIGELKDPEERDKVGRVIDKLCLLINKGVEIYSTIDAPKDIKVLFPMQESKELLSDNFIKLLESRKEQN